jgi:hypothetical protein
VCVTLSTCRSARRPSIDAKGGWVKPGRCTAPLSSSFPRKRLLSIPPRMPSRQERRKPERDAAKRAPAQAGAAGAAVALANVHLNPRDPAGGDWTTQGADPNLLARALGWNILKQRAGAGDREPQWSLGFQLLSAADGVAGTPLGAAGRSPEADVGLALYTAQFPVARKTEMRRGDPR